MITIIKRPLKNNYFVQEQGLRSEKMRSILVGVCEHFFATITQLLGKRGSFSEVSIKLSTH